MNRILVLMAILGLHTSCLAINFNKVTVPSINFGSVYPPFMTQLPNGNIFLLGNNLGVSTYEFNPVSSDLIPRASMPVALYDDSCVVTASNGNVYVIGGLLSAAVSATNPFVQIYNSSSDEWTSGQNITTPRNRMACAYDSVKQNIHVLGGYDSTGNPGAPHEVYSILNNTWKSAANPADTHGRLGRGYYEPKSASIVFLGGAFSSAQSVYNTQTGQWTTWAPMPQQLYYFGLTVLADRVLAFGGAQSNYFLTYYFANNTWTTQTTNVSLNFFHNTAVIGGSIYAMSASLSLYVTYCQVPENCVTDCTNGCALETGVCVPLNGLLCNDFDNCTIGDTCFGGQCIGNQTAPECLPPVSEPVSEPVVEAPQVIDTPHTEPVAAPVQNTPLPPRNVSQGSSLWYFNEALVVLLLLLTSMLG